MKNKIAFLTIVSGFVLSVGCGFAFAENSATFDMLKNANGIPNYDNTAENSGAPPPTVPGLNEETASAPTSPAVYKSTITVAAVPPPAPAKPTLLERMGKELMDNKVDYAVIGATGALTGYFLAGCALAGALPGLGIIVAFFLLFRTVK